MEQSLCLGRASVVAATISATLKVSARPDHLGQKSSGRLQHPWGEVEVVGRIKLTMNGFASARSGGYIVGVRRSNSGRNRNEWPQFAPSWFARFLAGVRSVAGFCPGAVHSASQTDRHGRLGQARQGWSVSLSRDGNTAIVGGINDNGGVGAAWVYTRSGGVWSEQVPLRTRALPERARPRSRRRLPLSSGEPVRPA